MKRRALGGLIGRGPDTCLPVNGETRRYGGRFLSPALACLLFLPLAANAAELGRHSGGAVPTSQAYERNWTEATSAVELGVDFLLVDWDVGSTSFDDSALAPVLGISFSATRAVDLRAMLSFYSVEDTVDEAEVDLDVFSAGIGARYWFDREADFSPVLGVSLSYLSLDSDAVSDLDGTLGLAAEAGMAFQGIDNLQVQAGLILGASVIDSEGTVDGAKQDVSLTGIGVGVKAVFSF